MFVPIAKFFLATSVNPYGLFSIETPSNIIPFSVAQVKNESKSPMKKKY